MNNFINNNLEFNTIYSTFKPKIDRYLTRLVGSDEAEDLSQEVFNKIYLAIDSFKKQSSLSTWIYKIATNTAMDRLRSKSFRQAHKEKPFLTEEDLINEDQAIWNGKKVLPVDQQLIEKEMNECIRIFIDRLPEDYRTVLLLSEIENLKNKEIAFILNITLDTTKIRLHRARAKLKKELECYCHFYYNGKSDLACQKKEYPF